MSLRSLLSRSWLRQPNRLRLTLIAGSDGAGAAGAGVSSIGAARESIRVRLDEAE